MAEHTQATNGAPTQEAFGSHYLRSAHIDAFGSILQRDLGPYSPGLNLVFGTNEAGKTTTSTFVGGVLFGWPEARGGRNAYRPAGAHRSGTLIFAPRPGVDAAADIICSRAKNAEGIKPDPEPAVLDDIDPDTYRTVFALTSDELLDLRGGSDITAHLLTAGAGTAVSPARALEQVDAQIAACHSQSGNYPDSIPNIQREAERVAEALNAAADEAEIFKKEAREYAELGPQIAEANDRLKVLNAEVDLLSAQTTALEQLEEQRVNLDEQHQDLLARTADLAAREEASNAAHAVALDIDDSRARALRDELEDLAIKQSRLESDLDQAEEDYAHAQASFAALSASGEHLRAQKAAERQRKVTTALVFMLPALFAICSIFMFVLARDADSNLPFIAGIIFAIAALVFAGFGSASLSRQGSKPSASQVQLDEATRALEEAEQQLSVRAEALERHAFTVKELLDSNGLARADGNIRYARALLEDAREARSEEQLLAATRAHLATDNASYADALERNAAGVAAAYRALGLAQDTPLHVLKERLVQCAGERAELQTNINAMNERSGQLHSELERAQHLKDFDTLKLQSAQLATRMADTQEVYARLLLERRLLAEAIEAWEAKSQPEVYQQASRLLSLMTEGSWTQVEANGHGSFVVRDEFGNERDPALLSTGTCQQLYLALRIALLMTAENVGRCIPVLADDILVNFDAQRRIGAARALEELSRLRQVIVFTCHEEVVRLMQETCQDLNLVEL